MAKTPEQIEIENNFLEACKINDLQTVKEILAGNYFKEYKNKQFFLNEGLARATHSGIDVIHYLLTSPDLELHADIHENHDRPLRLAIKRGTFEQVQYLCISPELTKHSFIGLQGQECAFLEACEEGTLECVDFLLTHPQLKGQADIHMLDNYKHDALFHACRGRNLPVVKFLLTSPKLTTHSNIHLCGSSGLFYATSKGDFEIAKYLCFSPELKEHVDIEKIKENLAFQAVEFEQLHILKWLGSLETQLKLNHTDHLKTTVYEKAVHKNNLETLNYLLYDLKCNVTDKEKEKVRSYRSKGSLSHIEMIERRDLFFKMKEEMDTSSIMKKSNKI